MPRKPITFAEVTKLALTLPEVETGTIHGATSLKVRGKLLACPALHRSAEPDTLAVRLDPEERTKLLLAYPDIYYVTAHYVGYPTILVRLPQIDRRSLKQLLLTAHNFVTAKRRLPRE